ncbi:uncharacterized protein METZ01_LOCUS367614, partial [marine metagenome]
MRVTLIHAKDKIKWKGPWLYFGNSFMNMWYIKKSLSGNEISLTELINLESKNQRNHILYWLKLQREANNDSLYWWMSQLAGKNNCISEFYINLVKIFAFKEWLKKNNSRYQDVLVIYDDVFVMLSLYENIQSLVKIKHPKGWRIKYIKECYKYWIIGIKNFIEAIKVLLNQAYYAKRTKTNCQHCPSGEIYLIHQCLDDKSFIKSMPVSSRYFTFLPLWLEKKGKNVYSIPWLYNIKSPLISVYESLRNSKYIIPQDWLTIGDYISAIFKSIKSLNSIKSYIPYNGLDNI